MTTLEIIFNNKVLGCQMCACHALSLLAWIIPLILWIKVKGDKKDQLFKCGVQDVLIRYSFLKMKYFHATSHSVTGAINFAFLWHSNLLSITQFLPILKLLLKKKGRKLQNSLIPYSWKSSFRELWNHWKTRAGSDWGRLEWSKRKTCLETQKCWEQWLKKKVGKFFYFGLLLFLS